MLTEYQEDTNELNPFNMLLGALSWNVLNVIRVELFYNCYRIWDIFRTSSLQSPRGQHAIVSLFITFLAHLAVQFNLGWLLYLYIIYLATGMTVWLHRRVYFYHRRLDSLGVNQTIHHFDQAKTSALAAAANFSNGHSHSTGTLKHSDKQGGSSSSSSGSSSTSSTTNENTNSLQRQRATAYRDFQSVLNEPRRSHREFALSLAHLSHVSKLVADKDVFDEMHFQILATRRDVVNLILRSVLLTSSMTLAYFR